MMCKELAKMLQNTDALARVPRQELIALAAADSPTQLMALIEKYSKEAPSAFGPDIWPQHSPSTWDPKPFYQDPV